LPFIESLAMTSRLAPALMLAVLISAPAIGAEPASERDTGWTVLHLSETAEKPVRRDRLRADLRVEATAPDAVRAQTDVNRRMAVAVERAKALSGLQIQTGGYSIYQERPQNAPARWRASQGLVLTGRDPAPLLQLVGELQGDGMLIGGLSFELAAETAKTVQDELTEQALARLRERAEKVAGQMGLSLARFRDVRVGNAMGDRRPPIAMRAVAAEAAQAAAPAVAEPGDAVVQVTVEADILLDNTDPRRP
jgi:predicted secreted protein